MSNAQLDFYRDQIAAIIQRSADAPRYSTKVAIEMLRKAMKDDR